MSEPVGSLWEASATPDPSGLPIEGDARAEVCIVGAGFTGLSAALRLAVDGSDVLVLDQGGAGFGASGRNGGQVLPGLKWDPDELVDKLGEERGNRLAAFAGAAPELVYRLVEKHGIGCGLRRNCGWLNAAVDEAAFAKQAARAEQWARRGATVRLAEQTETAEILGMARYRGGLLDELAGALNPLAYARGLAVAAQRLGARVHGGTRVRALSREGGRWKLSAGSCTITADTVLLCTNGYTDGLWPGLAHEIIPIHSLQVATEPLGDDVRRSILPRGHVTQRILLYFRLDDRGRLVMGGRGSLGETNRESPYRFVEDAACRLLPQIGSPRWQYRWAGKVALTADHLPRVHELAPGLHACLGYNGRGVAMPTALCRALGERVSSGDPESLPLRPTPIRPLPLHAFCRPVLEVVTAWLRLRDRMAWKASFSEQGPPASPSAGM